MIDILIKRRNLDSHGSRWVQENVTYKPRMPEATRSEEREEIRLSLTALRENQPC